MAIFHCYVNSPEGKSPLILHLVTKTILPTQTYLLIGQQLDSRLLPFFFLRG